MFPHVRLKDGVNQLPTVLVAIGRYPYGDELGIDIELGFLRQLIGSGRSLGFGGILNQLHRVGDDGCRMDDGGHVDGNHGTT